MLKQMTRPEQYMQYMYHKIWNKYMLQVDIFNTIGHAVNDNKERNHKTNDP